MRKSCPVIVTAFLLGVTSPVGADLCKSDRTITGTNTASITPGAQTRS
jgi:hypothetical protein